VQIAVGRSAIEHDGIELVALTEHSDAKIERNAAAAVASQKAVAASMRESGERRRSPR